MLNEGMSTDTFRKYLKAQVEELCDERAWSYSVGKYRGTAFQLWLASLFQQAYQGVDTEPDEAIIEGTDLGADIVLDDAIQKRLIIVQSKLLTLVSHSKPMDETQVASFFDRHRYYCEHDWVRKHGSQKAVNLLGDYKSRIDDGYAVSYFFVSTGKLTERISELTEKRNRDFGAAGESVTCTTLGIHELREFFVRTQSLEGTVGIDIEQPLPKDTYFIRSKPRKTLVCAIKGNWLRNLYEKKGVRERLFALNIRDWLGRRTSINKDIVTTIEEEPENFFYFNNGISCVCTSLEVDSEHILRAENFYIINGAQTVGAIVDAKSEAEIYVLMRITESSRKTQIRGINEKIIRFNNTKNAIRISDFRANDQIQEWLEKNLSPKRGRDHLPLIEYHRRRGTGARTKSGSRILRLDEFAKIRYAFEYEPTLVINSPKDLFTSKVDHSEGAYEKAFGVNGKLEILLPEAELHRARLGIAFFWRTQKSIKEYLSNNDGANYLNQLRYHILSLIGESVRAELSDDDRSSLLNNDRNFEKYWDKCWKASLFVICSEWQRNESATEPMTLRTFARSAAKFDLMKSGFNRLKETYG
ncbi:MAG: AIPR family protein [Planctomycetes bacterium]|nr:AIPR family protein [Planctomycetota bacterium]